MRSRHTRTIRLLLVALFALTLTVRRPAEALQFHVPNDYGTIQEAIEACNDDDEVVVADGTYTGPGNRDIDFAGKAIIVRSANGPSHCIIDCQGTQSQPHRAFVFQNGEGQDSILEGFTISNGCAAGDFWWEDRGGGIYCSNGSPTIRNNIISSNTAESGAGIWCSGSPLISDNTIANNIAVDAGGGINCYEGATIANNTITKNRARQGAGIWTWEDYPATIINNVIRDNWADEVGGGIGVRWDEGTVIAGNLVVDNVAGESGGGIHLDSDPATIANNTIAWNFAREGGGIYAQYTAQTATNCILWGDYNDLSGCSATYSCIEDGAPGEGNTDAPPLFVDVAHGNFRLRPDSLCVDAGNNAAVPPELIADLDGNPRVANGVVDMGAYESRTETTLYVDDDAPADPGPGDPLVSDPLEDGSPTHPFDAIQEAIDAALSGDTVVVLDGTYTGAGNRDVDFLGKAITVRSMNGPAGCLVDGEGTGSLFHFRNGEARDSILDGFTLRRGMGNGGGVRCSDSSPTLIDCVFTNHTTGDLGAGVYSESGNPRLVGCVFRGNSSSNLGGGWGSIGGRPELINCLFSKNVANYGGAVCADNGDPRLVNCTLVGNRAREECGGILSDGARISLTNCILWNNRDENGTNEGAQIDDGPFTVNYSCIQNWSGDWGGTGNHGLTPLFVDPGYWDDGGLPSDPSDGEWIEGDCRLQAGSPCRDCGDNTALPPEVMQDLDGNPRIANGTVDMGVYEFQEGRELYVDDDAPHDPGPNDPHVSDPLEDGTREHPFDRVQEAIDIANDGDTVIVLDGTYERFDSRNDPVADFNGKAITVRSENGPQNCILSRGDHVVRFRSGETSRSVLMGFTITWADPGGGIGVYDSSPVIMNNIITDNWSEYGLGAILLHNSRAIVANNIICGNEVYGPCAGIVCCHGTTATIINNTIAENSGGWNNDGNGSVYCNGATARIANCIFWDNGTVDLIGCSATYSCFEHPTAGAGNIQANPRFVRDGYWDLATDRFVLGDYHLFPDSLCLNTGSNAAIPAWLVGDFEGNPRILGDRCDMGAYEAEGGQPPPSRLYVDASANGANSGTSWTDAYTDLQDALAVARVWFGLVEEVWVADGVYKPDRGSGNRTATFEMMNGLAVYGGFAGGETDLTERNPSANPTILSGDLAGDDLPGFVNNAENSYHIVVAQQVDPTAVLDGFVIAGGNATIEGSDPSIPWRNRYGGGMLVDAGMPTIMHCFFRGNYAIGAGGGVYASVSSPTLVSCVFTGNAAGDYGGGMSNDSCGSTLINCSFSGNWGAQGGALASYDRSNVTVTNCIIWGNGATEIYEDASIPPHPCHLVDHSCVRGGGYFHPSNIDDDPFWIDANGSDGIFGTSDDDLRLRPGSPCVDTGSSWPLVHLPAPAIGMDLDGNPRVVNGEVDMGPYEFQGPFGPFELYVDDDAPNDPGPGNPEISDPLEDGTPARPFDAIQEAISHATNGSTITVLDGTYIGPGNRDVLFLGKAIVVRSQNGPGNCIVDCDARWQNEHRGFLFENGEGPDSVLDGLTIMRGYAPRDSGDRDESGGAILCDASSPRIVRCVIARNIAYWDGGGILCVNGSAATIADCIITSNSSEEADGGGIACLAGSDATITGCILADNEASGGAGGGVFCKDDSNATIANCTFAGNTRSGITAAASAPVIRLCRIVGNRGTGIAAVESGDPVILGTLIAGNTYGAVSCRGSSRATLINCTLACNRGYFAGGVYCENSQAAIHNSIIWNNEVGSVVLDAGATATITHSDVQGGFAGLGNLDADPLFVSLGYWDDRGTPDTWDDLWVSGDLRVQQGSPCINAGDNAAVPPLLTADLDGNPRIVFGIVDMGAYESQNPPPPPRLYVDEDATGANDGTSWADAFDRLDDALHTATVSNGIVEEIWVAAGTYRPTPPIDLVPVNPRVATFQLVNGVAVYGGFTGTETELDQRDVAAYETILSGDLNGDDGPDFTNNGENSFHVVVAMDTGPATVLDGFTVTGGNANGPYGTGHNRGGGMVIDGGEPIVANCLYTRNRAGIEGSGGGGGMYNLSGNPTLIGCVFRANQANHAGALSTRGPDAVIINCAFVDNSAAWSGGAVTGNGTFVNCRFSGNRAEWGGGALSTSMCDLALINCTFHGNRSPEWGGAIHLGVEVDAVMHNSILWENSAPIGPQISISNEHHETELTITHSDIEGSTPGLFYYPQNPNPYTWGPGNIDADPAFVAPGHWDDAGTTEPADDVWIDGDYRLAAASPCVDAANNLALPPDTADLDGDGDTSEALSLDLAGDPRVISGTVDMGAYECPLVPPPSRLYVDDTAAGANNGTSWADAFNDLQDALELAAQWPGVVQEIWVAEGTYKPDRDTGDRFAAFWLVDGVAVCGGFAGVETELDQRDVAANETILSGDLNGDDGPDFANNGENSYNVVATTTTLAMAVLDGFVITGGNADLDAGPDWWRTEQYGGGMCNWGGSPTVANCTFRTNAARSGGAMCNWGGTPTVVSCTFIDNAAEGSAGAMFNEATNQNVFSHLTFIGNTAGGMGGAVWNWDIGPTYVNCAFSGNTAGGGGGAVWNVDGGGGTWINCTFSSNTSAGSGGAINSDYWPAMINCIFWGNRDTSGTGELSHVHANYESPGFNYSCVEGWTGAMGGIGNHGDDPQFVDADGTDDVVGTEDDNVRLRPGSHCRDCGDNAALPPDTFDLDGDGDSTEPIPLDLDGNPRVLYDIVDMGAYECTEPGHLPATICIYPRTLNRKSKGTWITCFIELPAPHEARDIVVGSLLLNGLVAAEAHPAAIDDHNENGIPDLMVKFPRDEAIAILAPGDEVEIVVTGTVAGTDFRGTDVIRVIEPGIGPQRAWPGRPLEFSAAPLAEGLSGKIVYQATNLPEGARLDPDTGGFRWTPSHTQIGVYDNVTFTAASKSDEVVDTITITVEALPGTCYVDDDAPGDPAPGDPTVSDPLEDGTLAHPFDAIQEAIGFAPDGGTVIVLNGTYTGPGNRDIDFGGKPITVRSHNGPETCIVDCQGSEADPHRGFYFHSGEDHNCVLDGFTISNGYARYGGGIYCGNDSSPAVTNCIFRANSAYGTSQGGDGTSFSGGGICSVGNCRPTLTNCTFSDNRAVWGGAMSNEDGSCAILTNCTFVDNWALNGGAVRNINSDPILVNCTFIGNSATYCGGVRNKTSNATLANCIFIGNRAVSGGGMYNYDFSRPTVTNCLFVGNSAENIGGGVWNERSTPTLTHCTFSANMARNFGGAICNTYNSRVTLRNCILWSNEAGQGPEIALYDWDLSNPSMMTVSYSSVEGGIAGVYVDPGCTLNWGDGNMDADPLFADAANDDYHLLAGSPCIDAGDNTLIPPDTADLDGDGDTEEPIPLDLDGNVRFVDDPNTTDTGNGALCIADMGAYEFGSSPPPPSRLYVDQDAAGADNGTSWADAFNDLQDALDLAAQWPCVVQEIWVAEGTYNPDRETGERTATFQLVSGVAVYGGFAGVETELAQRDVAANETILSGDLNGDDGTAPHWDTAENSYHVVTGTDLNSATVLDGFTITAGNADGPWDQGHAQGGGMTGRNINLTIAGCTFTRNCAEGGSGLFHKSGSPTLIGCVFQDNVAQYGGALCGGGSDTMIIDCTFLGNSTSASGGAACSNGTFVNCRFSGNTAGWGGGALFTSMCDLALINCTFHGNRALKSGGAIHLGVEVDAAMHNCILWGNSAPIGPQIAIYNDHWETELTITHSDVEGSTPAIYSHPDVPNPILWGSGNIDADPAFVAPGHWDDAGTTEPADDAWIDGDYRLGAASPCIDAADNTALPPDTADLDGDGDTSEPLSLDLDGQPRIQNGVVDMGAHESTPAGHVHASICIHPRTLNLKSNGRWVTCFIELPAPHDVRDIDVGSLRLEGIVAAAPDPTAIGDHNENGIPDLMVKFPRDEFIATLDVGDEVSVTVTGMVGDVPFEGFDVIRVIRPGVGNQKGSPGRLLTFSIIRLAEGLTGPVTYSAENLPAGATLDPATGLVCWTPAADQLGVYGNIVLEATGVEEVATDIITISVEESTGVRPGCWRLYR